MDYGLRTNVTEEEEPSLQTLIDAHIKRRKRHMDDLARIIGAHLLDGGQEIEASLSTIGFLAEDKDYLLDLRQDDEKGTIKISIHKREDYYKNG